MKRLFIAIFVFATVAVSAQNLRTFKEHLSSPVKVDSLTTIRTTVEIVEHDDAALITDRVAPNRATSVNGYRIMLFMSNSQSARADAFAACDSLALRMPQLKTYVTYDNPYFKVTAGNCTTQEEALILLERVKPTFPKAFIMRENIPMEELKR